LKTKLLEKLRETAGTWEQVNRKIDMRGVVGKRTEKEELTKEIDGKDRRAVRC
jgi:hypothetical protein